MTLQTTTLGPALADDWGLLYGYGVFETCRVYDGMPFMLDEHLARMFDSLAALDIIGVPSIVDVGRRTRAHCAEWRERLVRITVTAGNPDAAVPPALLLTDREVRYTPADQLAGLRLGLAHSRRDEGSPIVRHKTLNQLQNVLECHDAMRRGYAEALFFNRAGALAEGARSNVFVVRDGEVVTPPVEAGILPGIARGLVMTRLRAIGIPVREADVTRDELWACDECFLTNSHMEVMPVTHLADRPLGRPDRPLTRMAQATYRDAVREASAIETRGAYVG
jgi:branched-subunit amino acid aminotransferase/4-amino-4-deoxychorismate lyase